MSAYAQIVIVAVKLSLMTIASRKLIHGRKFQMDTGDVVVTNHGRHVQESCGP